MPVLNSLYKILDLQTRVRSTEELRLSDEEKNPLLNELNMEIECPRCNGVMELHSSFDKLVYFCENCSFILTGV